MCCDQIQILELKDFLSNIIGLGFTMSGQYGFAILSL